MKRPIYTPGKIERLEPHEIIVVGSNLAGLHSSRATKTARMFGAKIARVFGSKYAQDEGAELQKYGIPTMNGGVDVIAPYVHEFIDYARRHGDKLFYVTRIGCGIAGFTDEEIAPLFRDALILNNVCLPESFVEVLNDYQIPESYKIREYGMTRTLADIVKVLNREKLYVDYADLVKDLDTVFEDFVRRGTVTSETIDLLKSILFNYEALLFKRGVFDVVKLDELLNDREGVTTELKSILKRREFAKLVYIIQLLNSKRKYASSQDVIDDIFRLHQNRDWWNVFNENEHILHTLKYGLRHIWDSITVEGVLQNDLLEQKMFEEHNLKVKRSGLASVLKSDYRDNSCHAIILPLKPGTGPVYRRTNSFPPIVKACGEGMESFRYNDMIFDIIFDGDY